MDYMIGMVGTVLHGLQIGAWCYGVARERLSSFLAVRAFSSSQHHEAAIRVDGLSRFQEIQKHWCFILSQKVVHFALLELL